MKSLQSSLHSKCFACFWECWGAGSQWQEGAEAEFRGYLLLIELRSLLRDRYGPDAWAKYNDLIRTAKGGIIPLDDGHTAIGVSEDEGTIHTDVRMSHIDICRRNGEWRMNPALEMFDAPEKYERFSKSLEEATQAVVDLVKQKTSDIPTLAGTYDSIVRKKSGVFRP